MNDPITFTDASGESVRRLYMDKHPLTVQAGDTRIRLDVTSPTVHTQYRLVKVAKQDEYGKEAELPQTAEVSLRLLKGLGNSSWRFDNSTEFGDVLGKIRISLFDWKDSQCPGSNDYRNEPTPERSDYGNVHGMGLFEEYEWEWLGYTSMNGRANAAHSCNMEPGESSRRTRVCCGPRSILPADYPARMCLYSGGYAQSDIEPKIATPVQLTAPCNEQERNNDHFLFAFCSSTYKSTITDFPGAGSWRSGSPAHTLLAFEDQIFGSVTRDARPAAKPSRLDPSLTVRYPGTPAPRVLRPGMLDPYDLVRSFPRLVGMHYSSDSYIGEGDCRNGQTVYGPFVRTETVFLRKGAHISYRWKTLDINFRNDANGIWADGQPYHPYIRSGHGGAGDKMYGLKRLNAKDDVNGPSVDLPWRGRNYIGKRRRSQNAGANWYDVLIYAKDMRYEIGDGQGVTILEARRGSVLCEYKTGEFVAPACFAGIDPPPTASWPS